MALSFGISPQGARSIGAHDSRVAFGQSRVLLVCCRPKSFSTGGGNGRQRDYSCASSAPLLLRSPLLFLRGIQRRTLW